MSRTKEETARENAVALERARVRRMTARRRERATVDPFRVLFDSVTDDGGVTARPRYEYINGLI